jgi:hypothetical protein
MLEMARKACARVAGRPRADFDADEDLRHLSPLIDALEKIVPPEER